MLMVLSSQKAFKETIKEIISIVLMDCFLAFTEKQISQKI